MARKITVILKNGTELVCKDARVIEVNKIWIYQVNKNKQPGGLLALIDQNYIQALHAEGD
jgi:hypothetical protein